MDESWSAKSEKIWLFQCRGGRIQRDDCRGNGGHRATIETELQDSSMISPSLREISDGYESELSAKWTRHLDAYGNLFGHFRDASINFLEIGTQTIATLEIWSKYFFNAEGVIGCVVDGTSPVLTTQNARIHAVVGDADTENVEQQILGHAKSFDIVINNGSRSSKDILRSFARYFRTSARGESTLQKMSIAAIGKRLMAACPIPDPPSVFLSVWRTS